MLGAAGDHNIASTVRQQSAVSESWLLLHRAGISEAGFRNNGAGFLISEAQFWTSEVGFSISEAGLQIGEAGFQRKEAGFWIS